MEFKGTKGKWVLYSASSPSINEYTKWSVYNGIKRIALCYNLFENDQSLNFNIEEAKANSLLISKAPEMLEMLEKAKTELSRIKGSMMANPDCTQDSEFDDYTSSAQECEEEIEELIKQATEL